MATIKDIARIANVSPSTVSFVLNGKAREMKVSPATEQRILEIVAATGYRPSNVARRLLHLPQQGEMVLVMSGSIGCGPMTTLALKLLRRLPKDSFVVVICGKNKGDLKELQRYAKFLERLYPVGFTDRMDLYYSAADLVVGKPGGLSCTEIAQKRVPAVLMLSVPGCESRNLEFFTRYGMALGTESVRDTLSAVRRLLGSAAMRNRMMLAQRSIPQGAVAAITDLIEKGMVPLPAKEE